VKNEWGQEEEDVLSGGEIIGKVVKTGPVWLALAFTRQYLSMDEVAKALPSKAAAIEAVRRHARY
jgi:hypothetical protein